MAQYIDNVSLSASLTLKTTLWYLLLGLMLIKGGSCKNKEKVSANSKSALKTQVLVQIDREGCRGKCPSYKATFFSDGKMKFEGRAFVFVTGNYEYIVPESLVKKIQEEAKRINWGNFQAQYPQAPDAPETKLRVVYGRVDKTVAASMSAPDEVFKFQKSVHEEVMAIVNEQPGTKIE